MNDLLQIRGNLISAANTQGFHELKIPSNCVVTSEHLSQLIASLESILAFWLKQDLIDGSLLCVNYNRVIPKSSRIDKLFGKSKSTYICGVCFNGQKHTFTYYMKKDVLNQVIDKLRATNDILQTRYNGQLNYEDFVALNAEIKGKKQVYRKLSAFLYVISDICEIESFSIPSNTVSSESQIIVTLYKTDKTILEIFNKFNYYIPGLADRLLTETSILLFPNEIQILQRRAPFLIAMGIQDLNEYNLEDTITSDSACDLTIPSPRNEPTIGVIDTIFETNVYFKDWVEYHCKVNPEIPQDENIEFHGTAVSSIIVDGPTLNPDLDDNCGRFKVRHFGICNSKQSSSFEILRKIQEIVQQNPDIKVWNLSLGSTMEISNTYISPEAAILDSLQSQYDIIFVVAGTNRTRSNPTSIKIGAPADSLNSVVVNACDRERQPVSYHRCGPVLSFFNKPDLSYFGGTANDGVTVCASNCTQKVYGTSYAAPWISRKLAYLIHKLSLPREVAKALLIDAAAGWNASREVSTSIGYGVVPQKIENIVRTEPNEIKFFISGVTETYKTYAHNLPVPLDGEKFPFFAKATLCCCPPCTRDQGVDYTDIELSFNFGRVHGNNIVSLDKNPQDSPNERTTEDQARKVYRKWDNVKHICEPVKAKGKPRKSYGSNYWGVLLVSKKRQNSETRHPLRFGLVVTLREINGVNRYDEFIKLCSFSGWLVHQISIEQRLSLYEQADTEVVWQK